MIFNKKSYFITGYYLMMLVYWYAIRISNITDLKINLMYSFSLELLGCIGGVFGLVIAYKWGLFRSSVGKAILFFSSGLISWAGLGGFFWSYYNFVLNRDVPYPSLSDVGFIAAIPLWVLGIVFLSSATGVRLSLKKIGGRIFLVLLPIVATIVSYYLLFVVARQSSFSWDGGSLKVFFDLAYPVGDWIILTAAFLIWGLSLHYLGGRYRLPIFIVLLGFIAMFMADFTFSYTTTVGSYFNGSYPDLLFVTALALLSLGISCFDVQKDEV